MNNRITMQTSRINCVADDSRNLRKNGKCTIRAALSAVLALLVLGCIAGCIDSAEEPTGDQSSDLYTNGTWFYDTSTQCTAAGLGMHCCPYGFVMMGANLGNNVFKCEQLIYSTQNRFVDAGTQRNGMHACPWGSVMVGLHAGHDILLCELLVVGGFAGGEYVDTGTVETFAGFPMHTCSGNFAIAGIDVANNRFTCDI